MFYLHFINTVVRRNRMRQVGLKTQKVSVHRNNIQIYIDLQFFLNPTTYTSCI